jgi:hypothetical protein
MTAPALTDRLIEAWVAWETQPRSNVTTDRKMGLLADIGLPCIETHDLVARQRDAGYDVPSAVQTAVNELTQWKEAS